MYNRKDNTIELLAHRKSVAEQGDKICTKVKRGIFNINTDTINSYQSIEYMLNKLNSISDFDNYKYQNIQLIDKLQDYHKKEYTSFNVPFEPEVPTVQVYPTYTEPILKWDTNQELTPQDLVVGSVLNNITMTVSYEDTVLDGASTGYILEPWNNDAIQNERVGSFVSASTQLAKKMLYTYGGNGGIQYTTLGAVIPGTTISDSGKTINFNVNDLEIGYGTISLGLNYIRGLGVVPLDNFGNQVLDTNPAFQYNENGPFVGETNNSFLTGVNPHIAIILDGYYPIYLSDNTTEEVVYDFLSRDIVRPLNYNFNNYNNLPTNVGGSNAYVIRLSKEEVDDRGVKILADYGITDITSSAVQTTYSQTLSSGITVDYYRYEIPVTLPHNLTVLAIQWQSNRNQQGGNEMRQPIRSATIRVKRHPRMESSHGVTDSERNVIIDIKVSLLEPDYGCFELWDLETGGVRWYAEGGLWFDEDGLVDYDGVACIDDAVLEIVRSWGFSTKEVES